MTPWEAVQRAAGDALARLENARADLTRLDGDRRVAEMIATILMALGSWKTERMMRPYAAVTDATLRAGRGGNVSRLICRIAYMPFQRYHPASPYCSFATVVGRRAEHA